jgi:hypothetical protein
VIRRPRLLSKHMSQEVTRVLRNHQAHNDGICKLQVAVLQVEWKSILGMLAFKKLTES